MREALQASVKRVGELAGHEHEHVPVRGHVPPPFDFPTLLQRSPFAETVARRPASWPAAPKEGAAPDPPRATPRVPAWRTPSASGPGGARSHRSWTARSDPARSEPRPGGDASGSGSASASAGGRIETAQEELAAYEVIRRLLGPARPVAYEDTVGDFKIHLTKRSAWVMCRVDLGRKRPSVWVPLPLDQVQAISPGLMLNTPQEGWTCITLNASGEIEQLGDILRAAWDAQKAIRTRRAENADGDVASSDGSVAGSEPATVVANCCADPAKPSSEPDSDEYQLAEHGMDVD